MVLWPWRRLVLILEVYCSLFASTPEAPGSSGRGGQVPPSSQQQQQLPAPPPPLPPPPPGAGPGSLPSSADSSKHWLDRHLPGLRLWLEDKNRHWWIKGVVVRCRQHHQLQGREPEVRQAIEAAYQAALQRHQAAAVDERAETHVQVACLVLSTHKALLPWLRDEREVLKIIGEHMGGRTSALLRFLLAATKFLHRDGYAAMTARLRGLRTDLGQGFAAELELGESESSLTISRCLYHDIFESEGQPQLSICCCCTQDQIWFEPKYRGVEAGRTSAISYGDPCCRFSVRRVPPR
ncbi:hypothetical protein ABPG75_000551 [Micractinium tetrahymenae]